MDTVVQAAGLFNLSIAALHLGFWRLFRWKEQLPRLSRANAAIMQAMNWVLTVVLAGLGALCLQHAGALAGSSLGRELLGGAALLWLFRAALQPVYFGLASKVSAVFVPVFVLGAGLHALPLMRA